MGKVFRKPKGPSPEEIARANLKAQQEAERIAAAQAEADKQEAQARFAASDERKRQLKRKGRRTMIATPYGYLGDQSDFGTTGSLLT